MAERHDVDPVIDDEPGSSPEHALAAIKAAQESVRQQTEPSATAMFTAWGLAFLVAYTCLYLGYDTAAQTPRSWSMIVLAAATISAIVFTAVHIARRVTGIRGQSSRVGAMYGWSWCLSFLFAMVIFAAVANAGAPPRVMSILTNAVSLLIVAALYMAGGALWQEWRMFALGVWFVIVGAVAVIVAPPTGYLVQAFAGGGGFLIAAAIGLVMQRRAAHD